MATMIDRPATNNHNNHHGWLGRPEVCRLHSYSSICVYFSRLCSAGKRKASSAYYVYKFCERVLSLNVTSQHVLKRLVGDDKGVISLRRIVADAAGDDRSDLAH